MVSAAISPVVNPLAYNDNTISSTRVEAVLSFLQQEKLVRADADLAYETDRLHALVDGLALHAMTARRQRAQADGDSWRSARPPGVTRTAAPLASSTMEAKPGVVASLRSAIRRQLSEWGFSQWWKAIVAVVLASTAVFGGLDTVDTSVTPSNPATSSAMANSP